MGRSPLLGEFFGSFVLLLLGNGVCAAVTLRRSKAEGSGWLVVATGWALAVLCGIFAAQLFGSPDAHLNPAFTLAFSIKGHTYSNLLPYTLAQIGGGFCGAAVTVLFYWPHWAATEEPAAKLGVFATIPTFRIYGWAFFCELVATFILVLIAGSMSSKLVLTTGAVAGLSPLLVSSLVWSIGLSLGATTGYAINPARDLGPRLAHALLPIPGKGRSDWGYAWVPFVGPLAGAGLAGLVLRWLGA
ncbi:MAG: aquaporin family protein [Rhodospirillales bacterium]|nr:aquaporin family protein [Acetobacter sp.]